jgi:hypothetical protein
LRKDKKPILIICIALKHTYHRRKNKERPA